jgi:hypothetical protein
MSSTFTTNKNIEKPAYNDYAANPTGWSAPVNNDWDIIDRSLGGVQVMNPTGLSGIINLTLAQCQPPTIVIGTSISGVATLTAEISYLVPAGVGGVWTIWNNTTGNFPIYFGVGVGGAFVALPQGKHVLVYSDGTNVRFALDPIAGGANTQVQYNNNGALAGSSKMTFDGSLLSLADTLQANTSGSATGFASIAARKGGWVSMYDVADDAGGSIYASGAAQLRTDASFTVDGTLTSGGQVWAKATGVKFPDNTVQTTAAAFPAANPAASIGSQTLPSGIILKWGYTSIDANTSLDVTFATAFPNNCFIFTNSVTYDTSFYGPFSLGVGAISKTKAVMYNNNSYLLGFYWFAIGN